MKQYLVTIIMVSSVLAGCHRKMQQGNPETSITDSLSYRPEFHFAPKSTWANDPNGLVYFKDNYHLFFQNNPLGTKWGHMSWGHATTKNFIEWREEPVAIPEFRNADGTTTMIFSGTAIVDSSNTSGFGSATSAVPLVAIYTSSVDANGKVSQHQSVAYSHDGNTFSQYEENPVLDIGVADFRDPKVFWYDPAKKWVMIVAIPDQHKVHFYESINLRQWKYMSEFGNIGNIAKIWECPDIFPLTVSETGELKWVITVSAGHSKTGFLAMQYFLGDFDGNTFKQEPLEYPLYIDFGQDFYAGIIYNNLPSNDNRKIMIAWANSWEYANNIPTRGFRGMMSIPRELSLKKNEGKYALHQVPVRELENFRGEMLYEKDNIMISKGNPLKITNGKALDIQFSLFPDDAGKAGIKVFKGSNEETLIYYNKADNSIKLDRTQSGYTSFSDRFAGIESAPLSQADSIHFRILVDNSIVEVFINDGAKAITDLVFPKTNGNAVELFSENGNAEFKNVKVWKIKNSN